MVSWKDIKSPGDLWPSVPATRLVGVLSFDLLGLILGAGEADFGEEADLAGEEGDFAGEVADLGEEAHLAGDEADLGDEEAVLGDEDADLRGDRKSVGRERVYGIV